MQSLNEFIEDIENPHQRDSLRKLLLRDESYQMYLAGYQKNLSTERKNDHIQGEFKVLGTLNSRGQRAEYEVTLYRPNSRAIKSFWCSCPEHKFQSNKKNIFCKHICFLLCRVARVYSKELFETKNFTEGMFEAFVNAIEDNPKLMMDRTLCIPSENLASAFTEIKKALGDDDQCPICYDDIKSHHSNLSCPDCKNVCHKACMDIWLAQGHPTCVYCRSDVWKRYKK